MSNRPRRNTTVVRCLRLWAFLQGRRTRPGTRELSAHYGVSYRTIARDLEALEEAHFKVPPVWKDA